MVSQVLVPILLSVAHSLFIKFASPYPASAKREALLDSYVGRSSISYATLASHTIGALCEAGWGGVRSWAGVGCEAL